MVALIISDQKRTAPTKALCFYFHMVLVEHISEAFQMAIFFLHRYYAVYVFHDWNDG